VGYRQWLYDHYYKLIFIYHEFIHKLLKMI